MSLTISRSVQATRRTGVKAITLLRRRTRVIRIRRCGLRRWIETLSGPVRRLGKPVGGLANRLCHHIRHTGSTFLPQVSVSLVIVVYQVGGWPGVPGIIAVVHRDGFMEGINIRGVLKSVVLSMVSLLASRIRAEDHIKVNLTETSSVEMPIVI